MMLWLLSAVTSAWHPIDPQNALVVDTSKGRAVVALDPRLAPKAVARVKQLARMHVYDGLLMWRVVDSPGFNFIQTGDPRNHDGDRSALPDLRAEFSAKIPASQIRFVRSGSEAEGFLGVLPVGASSTTGTPVTWGAYCDGVMGMGRERDVDTANAEIFFMRGTTRYFDQYGGGADHRGARGDARGGRRRSAQTPRSLATRPCAGGFAGRSAAGLRGARRALAAIQRLGRASA